MQRVFITHIVWCLVNSVGGFTLLGARLEVCLGRYPSQDVSWGLTLAGGEGYKEKLEAYNIVMHSIWGLGDGEIRYGMV